MTLDHCIKTSWAKPTALAYLFPGLLLPDQAVSKTDTKTETEWQELLDFINLWQLDQACADYLVTQAPCGGVRNNGASWVAYR